MHLPVHVCRMSAEQAYEALVVTHSKLWYSSSDRVSQEFKFLLGEHAKDNNIHINKDFTVKNKGRSKNRKKVQEFATNNN